MERFTQAELASEIGAGRSAWGNWEYGFHPLPFAAGIALCRRLDLNPRWLASGEEPKRPFVKPSELGIGEDEILRLSALRSTFLDGYRIALEKPLAAWIEHHPPEDLVMRMLNAGPEGTAQRMSSTELESQIVRAAAEIEKADGATQLAWIRVLRVFLDVLEERNPTAKKLTRRSRVVTPD